MNKIETESLCKPLWRYGLFAIDSEILTESSLSFDQQSLSIADQTIPKNEIDRVLVVGAGKAGAGMAKGLLKSFQRAKLEMPLEGIVIVPDNCVEELGPITLHGGRPQGVNEPTSRGQEGARQMLDLVNSAGPRDLVICLVSGGGSALAPLPVDSVELEAKQEMTRFLSRAGANINQLNCVRSAISQIKGGGLVREFSGHSLHTLIISDVLGNPLETIASGMTVPQSIDYELALKVLDQFDPDRKAINDSIYKAIELGHNNPNVVSPSSDNIFHHIVGDNSKCVEAIANMANQLGYEVEHEAATEDEGDVSIVADRLWQTMNSRIQKGGMIRPYCLVSGGEPTVTLNNADGKGGRNQHLALLMLNKLKESHLPGTLDFEFVSLGTDGEDGPTDAAGAKVNPFILSKMLDQNLDIAQAIRSNNSYPFFDQLDGLIKTGPTHTNVCDIRVLVVQDNSMN